MKNNIIKTAFYLQTKYQTDKNVLLVEKASTIRFYCFIFLWLENQMTILF